MDTSNCYATDKSFKKESNSQANILLNHRRNGSTKLPGKVQNPMFLTSPDFESLFETTISSKDNQKS